jgi:iron-sulfur cluster assembly accessory protein
MYNLLRTLTTSIKSPIIVTDSAWNKMKTIYNVSNNKSFLFAASAGGCSGLNYEFKNVDCSVIDTLAKGSALRISMVNKDGLNVYIDPLSEMYLLDTSIDYISENYDKGVYESKFVFTPNSNLAGTCGCGVSFYMKDQN